MGGCARWCEAESGGRGPGENATEIRGRCAWTRMVEEALSQVKDQILDLIVRTYDSL